MFYGNMFVLLNSHFSIIRIKHDLSSMNKNEDLKQDSW